LAFFANRGDGTGCLGGRHRDIRSQNDIDLPADQLAHDAAILAIQDSFAVVDPDVLAFGVAQFGQSLSKDLKPLWVGIFAAT
jgi:hypothetical protein